MIAGFLPAVSETYVGVIRRSSCVDNQDSAAWYRERGRRWKGKRYPLAVALKVRYGSQAIGDRTNPVASNNASTRRHVSCRRVRQGWVRREDLNLAHSAWTRMPRSTKTRVACSTRYAMPATTSPIPSSLRPPAGESTAVYSSWSTTRGHEVSVNAS